MLFIQGLPRLTSHSRMCKCDCAHFILWCKCQNSISDLYKYSTRLSNYYFVLNAGDLSEEYKNLNKETCRFLHCDDE